MGDYSLATFLVSPVLRTAIGIRLSWLLLQCSFSRNKSGKSPQPPQPPSAPPSVDSSHSPPSFPPPETPPPQTPSPHTPPANAAAPGNGSRMKRSGGVCVQAHDHARTSAPSSVSVLSFRRSTIAPPAGSSSTGRKGLACAQAPRSYPAPIRPRSSALRGRRVRAHDRTGWSLCGQ